MTAQLVAERSIYDAPILKALRAFLVARSRYTEDAGADAYARGVRQYAVLGAGFDTFALRQAFEGLRVFEIDHPATQTAKRDLLAKASIDVPPSLAFVPVDFETQSLEAELAKANFDARAPAFFAWLGVVPYLSHEAVFDTLRYVAQRPEGTEVVFDFALPSDMLNERERAARERLAARVAEVGEPWQSFFRPDELVADVRALGFTHVEMIDSLALNDLYFRDRDDDLRLGRTGRLLRARVGSASSS